MELRFLTADDADAYWGIRLEALEREADAFGSSVEEHRGLSMEEIAARQSNLPTNKKSVPDLTVQDASAALPQNCQTTLPIIGSTLFSVNITLVIRFADGYTLAADLGNRKREFSGTETAEQAVVSTCVCLRRAPI